MARLRPPKRSRNVYAYLQHNNVSHPPLPSLPHIHTTIRRTRALSKGRKRTHEGRRNDIPRRCRRLHRRRRRRNRRRRSRRCSRRRSRRR